MNGLELISRSGIIATLIIVAVSCKNNASENTIKNTSSANVKCQINWVGHWRDEGDKGKFVRELTNEYMFLNQDVKVNLKFPEDLGFTDADKEIEFITTQINKPVADWDIIRLYGYYPEIGKKLKDMNWTDNDLVDFSQVPGFLDSHKSFMKSAIYKERFHNKFFGPYNECQLAALFVNIDVAKKMGITVKQFDMTFDDFLGYIKAANQYNKSHPYITPFMEYDWRKAQLIFKILYFSLLEPEEILKPILTPNKMEAIEKCFQAFEQLSKYNFLEKNWQNVKWAEKNANILKDSCLFFPNFTFMYNIWKKKDESSMGKVMPCEFPEFKPSKMYIGGYKSNWAVLKNAPHKEEAIKLLMYWCRPDIAEKWVRYSKSPSGVKGNLTGASLGGDVFDNYGYIIDKKYGDNLITDEDNEYIVGEKNISVPLDMYEVLEGKMSASQAIKNFKAKAK